jgi:hypothetical protein
MQGLHHGTQVRDRTPPLRQQGKLGADRSWVLFIIKLEVVCSLVTFLLGSSPLSLKIRQGIHFPKGITNRFLVN